MSDECSEVVLLGGFTARITLAEKNAFGAFILDRPERLEYLLALECYDAATLAYRKSPTIESLQLLNNACKHADAMLKVVFHIGREWYESMRKL